METGQRFDRISQGEFQSAARQARSTLKVLENILNGLNGPAASTDDVAILHDLYPRPSENKAIAINPVKLRATNRIVEVIEDDRTRQVAIMVRDAAEIYFVAPLASALMLWSTDSKLSKQIREAFGHIFPGQTANEDLVAICREAAAALLTVQYMNLKYETTHPTEALTFSSHIMSTKRNESYERMLFSSAGVMSFENYKKLIFIVEAGFSNNQQLLDLLQDMSKMVKTDFERLQAIVKTPRFAKSKEVVVLSEDQVKEVLVASIGASLAYAILVAYKDPSIFLKNPGILKSPSSTPNRQLARHNEH